MTPLSIPNVNEEQDSAGLPQPGRSKIRFVSTISETRTPRQIRVDICLKIAATHGVTLEAMYGPSRARKVAYARFEAWACLQAHGLSTVRIGRIFSRDHSTIVSGLKRRRALAQQEAA